MREESRPLRNASLLDRLGGPDAIERLVAAFYDRIEADPELRALFPDDLGPGRERQRLFLVEWLGGERRYSAERGHPQLRRRHFPFVITEELAERWLGHMAAASRAVELPREAAREFLAHLEPPARHIVNADDDVPREPFVEEGLIQL